MDTKDKLKKILEKAIEENASDIHISAGCLPVLRVKRALREIKEEKPISPEEAKDLAWQLMEDFQREEFLKQRDIDFAYDFEGKARFRVNIFFQRDKVSVALRLIAKKIRTVEELNLPPILHYFTKAHQGFVLITGASSQGKSTTLAALINEINEKRKEHIITIEDPIEYIFENKKSIIEQREVGKDALSFARALRAALREDPDVIMVGEMRDLETISTAITAAETGHLVFATLHTNSASQTIHRIIDVFPPHQQNQIRFQLANSILGVVAQRLLPTTDDNLVPACEVMISNSAISNLIRENRVHEIPSVIETSADIGMIPFNKSLTDLVREGRISKETALKYSLNPKELESRIEKL